MTEDMTRFLLDQFNILADAPGGVQRLRELILQLAVTGRLIAEVTGVKVAKTLKKDSDTYFRVLEKFDVNGELQLPKLWDIQKLSDISDSIQYGFTASASTTNTGIHFLRITDIQNNRVNWETVPFCTIDEDQVAQYLISDGDLLIARTGGTIGKSFLVENIPVKSIFASYLIRIKPGKTLDPKYFKIFASAPLYWSQISAKSMGTGQPNVSGSSLKSLMIPLPPLVIQRKIIEKVNNLMALCDDMEAKQTQKHTHLVKLGTGSLTALQQSTTQEELVRWWGHLQSHFGLIFDCVENVEALRQTILQLAVTGRLGTGDERDEPVRHLIRQIIEEKTHLIGSGVIGRTKLVPEVDADDVPYNIPQNWEWVRLDNLTYISTGSTPSTTNPDYYHNGNIPWVTSSQTSMDTICTVDKKITQKAVDDCSLKVYSTGTLLVALYGQGKTRGQVSELKIESTINQACAAICFFDISKGIKDYVKIVLKGNYHSIRSISAGGAQPNLNLDKIKRMLIPLPPLTEQQRIVEKMNQLMFICDQLEQRIKNRSKGAISLSNSTIQQIFGMA